MKYDYKMRFSPYGNSLQAKNYKEAWQKLQHIYPEYNKVKEAVQYLTRVSKQG
jgi:hypothetical protein